MKTSVWSVALAAMVVGCGGSGGPVRGPDMISVGTQEYPLHTAPAGYAVLTPRGREGSIDVPLTPARCRMQRTHERFYLTTDYAAESTTTERVLLEQRTDHYEQPCSVSLAGVPASLHIHGLEGRWTVTTSSGTASFAIPDRVLVLSPVSTAMFRTPGGVWHLDLGHAKALAAARLLGADEQR